MRSVEVPDLPRCYFYEPGVRARFDGPTRHGPHAFMCGDCLRVHGFPESSINRRLYVAATHHGPWCDEDDQDPRGRCPVCRPRVVTDVGLWLFARLAVHYEYNRRIPIGRQAPILGFEMNGADWLEVTQLQLELAKLRRGAQP